MHKRILAIALCLVMVSTFAVTSTVSAAQAGKSTTIHYNVMVASAASYDNGPGDYGYILTPVGQAGKLTIDTATGYYDANINLQKIGDKDWFAHTYPDDDNYQVSIVLVDGNKMVWNWWWPAAEWYMIEWDMYQTDGGTLHAYGQLSADQLTELNTFLALHTKAVAYVA